MTTTLVRMVLCLLPCLATAQSLSTTGVIQGVITDSSGGVVPDVRVSALRTGSGDTRVILSGSSGEFRFTGLPIGTYTLRLSKAGFTSVDVSPFLVSVGQTVLHRLEMKPAVVIEKIQVQEAPDALLATASTSSVVLGYDRIEEAPAQNRNYLSFVFTAPGVAPSSGSNTQRSATGTWNAANDSGMSFGGLRGRNNSLQVDGVDNRDESTGGNRVAIGLEMVQEFRVSATEVGAEFGGAAGGVMNVVTRSGSNTWHGDVTFFGQNERLNARNPEALVSRKPRFRQYQPGTSAYGPIRADRAFFAVAIEQEWESGEEWSDVPAEAAARVNAALQKPEYARAAVSSVQRGLFPSDSSGTQGFLKASYQHGTVHNLSLRYAFSRGRVSHDVQGVDNFGDRSSRGSSLTTDHSFVTGWAAVPSASRFHDLRLQVAERNVELAPNARGAMLEIPGILTLGQSYHLDASRVERHYEAVENLSLSRGEHQLSLGASLHIVDLAARMADRTGGAYLFPSLAAFLEGRPDVFFQIFGDARSSLATVPVGFWLQDRWQPAPGLTVEAGLRYDRQWMPSGFPAANRNLAPRLGLAWKPLSGSPLVFRIGAGLFYDRYPLAFLNQARVGDGVRGFEQYLAGEAAVAAFAEGRGGPLAAPLAGAPVAAFRPAAKFPAAYSRKFVAGLERGFGKDTTLTLDYSFIRGLHLPRLRNSRLGLPPRYELEQSARSAFHGGSVTLNRRMSRELSFLLAYNGGTTHDDGSDYDEQPMDPADTRKDWALSRQHLAHRLAASALFDLPVELWTGGPRWLLDPLERVTVAPIVTAGTGRPVNALDSTDTFRTGAYPISARPDGMARNPYISPGTFSTELRLMKTIPMKKERARMQFGVEFFNLTNHSNPLRVSPYYTARGAKLDTYRDFLETNNARQIGFFAQFEY